MKKLTDLFKTYPQRFAITEGYTDSTGDSAFNQSLSKKRAMAVQDSLVNMGVEGNRVSTRGFGETNLVADNTTYTGRRLNRRVDAFLPW